MKKLLYAAAISMTVFVSAAPSTALAVAVVPVAPPIPAAGGGAGAGATGGFIGFVGLLVSYDLIRRLSCSGDFLHLGGPGFSRPIAVGSNVMIPQCDPSVLLKHKTLHARD
jgi:hypothetical protein